MQPLTLRLVFVIEAPWVIVIFRSSHFSITVVMFIAFQMLK